MHPLFFAAVLVYTFFGGAFVYALTFLAVSLHEFSHYAVARLVGAEGLFITLMPYGATMRIEGEAPHLGAILFAGPLANLVLASLTLSACWIVPELYGSFKGFIRANVMLATLNLLPAYPLDGGRLLRLLFPGKVGVAFTAFCTVTIGVVSFAGFLCGKNISLLIFSAFMLSYFFAFCLKRPVRVKGSDPLYALVKTDERGRLRRAVVREGKKKRKLSPDEITRLCITFPKEMRVREALERAKGEFGIGYK